MVNNMRGNSIIRASALLVTGLMTLLLSSCGFFNLSPFPEYLGNTVAEYNMGDIISPLYDTGLRMRYELLPIEPAAGQNRLYMLLTPGIDETDPAPPTPSMLLFDGIGEYQGLLEDPGFGISNQFSHPFGMTNVGTTGTGNNLLAGKVALDPLDPFNTGSYRMVDASSGYTVRLSGTTDDGVYLCQETGGDNGSYFLEIYQNAYAAGTDWSLITAPAGGFSRINYIPTAEQPGDEELSAATDPIGYRLRAVLDDEGNDNYFFVEDLPKHTLYIWTLTDAEFHSIAMGNSSSSLRELNANSNRAAVDVKNGSVNITRENIIVRRTTGRFDRYDLNGNYLDSISSEAGEGVSWAVRPDGKYLFRFDPGTMRLQVIKAWW